MTANDARELLLEEIELGYFGGVTRGAIKTLIEENAALETRLRETEAALSAARTALVKTYEALEYWADEDTVYDEDEPLRAAIETAAALCANEAVNALRSGVIGDPDDPEYNEYRIARAAALGQRVVGEA